MEFINTFYNTLKSYYWYFDLECRSRISTSKQFSNKNRHLVLLAWKFPPAISGGVYRPLSLVRYGVEMGWKITVISGPLQEKPTLAGIALSDSIPNEVTVIRLRSKDTPLPSYNYFPHIDGGFINGLTIAKTTKNLLTEHPPTVVLATGPPFHSFIAAYYMARIFDAKFVIDYRDEWTECPFSFVDKSDFDNWWERRCLNCADAVIFTTQSQIEHNRKIFNTGDSNRFHLIPNGWEPTDFNEINFDNKYAKKTETLILSFLGRLGDHTLPGPFLDEIEKIFHRRADLQKKVKLQFVGQRSQKSEEQLAQFAFPQNLIIYDHVVKKEANRLMYESSGLLIFYTKKFKRYIPGKLYDYLASGRPIVVFGTLGEVPNILKKLKLGYLIPDGDNSVLEKTMDQLFDNIMANSKTSKIRNWLMEHTRYQMSRKFFEIFKEFNI